MHAEEVNVVYKDVAMCTDFRLLPGGFWNILLQKEFLIILIKKIGRKHFNYIP